MADEEKKTGEQFLSRWSQRKQAARAAPAIAEPATEPATPMPQLPPVDELTLDSDFSGFMHPKVDPGLRKAALQKLFSNPHFNVMDGLDTYVDDYSKTEPLPPGMLAGLRQAQNILAWAKETKEETAARFAPAPSASLAELPVEPAPLPEPLVQQSPAEQAVEAVPVAVESARSEAELGAPADSGERKP